MNRKLLARIALIVLALVLILAGILNGEASIVLRKAKDICLACIGIG